MLTFSATLLESKGFPIFTMLLTIQTGAGRSTQLADSLIGNMVPGTRESAIRHCRGAATRVPEKCFSEPIRTPAWLERLENLRLVLEIRMQASFSARVNS